jgi:alanine racemase
MEAVQRIIELERLVKNIFESPSSKDTNETVHSHFGLSQSPHERTNKQVQKFKSCINQSNNNNKSNCNNKKNLAVKQMSISDTMIKNRTGFGNDGFHYCCL